MDSEADKKYAEMREPNKICPYDKSHKLCERNYHKHIVKCKRNLIARIKLKGEPVVYMTCRFNPEHRNLLENEFFIHEAECKDRDRISFNSIRAAAKHFFPERAKLLNDPNYVEDDRILFSEEFIGQPVAMTGELGEMTADDVKGLREKMLKKILSKERLVHSGRMTQEEVDVKARARAEKLRKADKDDEWVSDSDNEQEKFDYVQNLWNPNKFHPFMPAPLTKTEKKVFRMMHGQRWDNEQRAKQLREEQRKRIQSQLPKRHYSRPVRFNDQSVVSHGNVGQCHVKSETVDEVERGPELAKHSLKLLMIRRPGFLMGRVHRLKIAMEEAKWDYGAF